MYRTPSSLALVSRVSVVTCLRAVTGMRIVNDAESRKYWSCSLDVPLVVQIRLVSYQNDDDILSPLVPDILDPFIGVLERHPAWKQGPGNSLDQPSSRSG